ncbi:MAG TPA: Flp pilus assembly protein CpaB [Polyangiales bacterium]|nr:Flp pilus assembly protein CpaB [Polyangiales bacterium]
MVGTRRALYLSLGLAVTGTILLLIYMRQFEQETSGGQRIELLVAVEPIARGTVVTGKMLATRSVPLAYVEDRAIKAVERAKVVGLTAANAIDTQQTMMWTDLDITTEDRDLSSLVQPGKRGVTVRAAGADDARGNALIRPGDYVDVITTMKDDETQEERAVVLFQRILVLAVGSETQPSPEPEKATGGRARSDKQLTLSLSLQEAQLLALAVQRGRLMVAVRGPNDIGITRDVPDLLASALREAESRQPSQKTPSKTGPFAIESTSTAAR